MTAQHTLSKGGDRGHLRHLWGVLWNQKRQQGKKWGQLTEAIGEMVLGYDLYQVVEKHFQVLHSGIMKIKQIDYKYSENTEK